MSRSSTPLIIGNLEVASLAILLGTLAVIAMSDEATGQNWLEEIKLTASNPAPRDGFGWSAALDGDWAIVGANVDNFSPGFAHVFQLTDGKWSEVGRLMAGDPNVSDYFGESVALDDNTAIVTAPAAGKPGAAYVFELMDSTWNEVATLAPADPRRGSEFGSSVDLDGDRAVVGDWGRDSIRGIAYVFERINGDWSEVATLNHDERVTGFGYRVSVDGDRALVGADGAAYIFEASGDVWTKVVKLTANDPNFGISVALDGDRALVGAFRSDVDPGTAYVFEQANGSWSQVAKLTADDADIGDDFGRVALDGDRALVSAWHDDHEGGRDAGSAYVFELADGVWSQIAKLTAADGTSGDSFGSAVALDGQWAIVGDAGDDARRGSAYIFRGPSVAGAFLLQAGDADQDADFDQLDLVQVQIAGKYLSGQPATWGDGDWDSAPGGAPGNPPLGDGTFNQLDIIVALASNLYLTGPYASLQPNGQADDGLTSILYDANTGELFVDAPSGSELSSINIDSAAGIFTGVAALNLGGSFDNDADNNIFKATFGSSFGSLSFGNVAKTGLTEEFVLGDLSVVGSLAGGGDLGNVDLVYVPEPSTALLLAMGLVMGLTRIRNAKHLKSGSADACRVLEE